MVRGRDGTPLPVSAEYLSSLARAGYDTGVVPTACFVSDDVPRRTT